MQFFQKSFLKTHVKLVECRFGCRLFKDDCSGLNLMHIELRRALSPNQLYSNPGNIQRSVKEPTVMLSYFITWTPRIKQTGNGYHKSINSYLYNSFWTCLTRQISIVILYWRNGCTVTGNVALYKFKDPTFRSSHVPYSVDLKRRVSGLQSSLQRLRQILSGIVKVEKSDINIPGNYKQ